MIIYRIKQFYWAVESLYINDDFEILNKYLNDSELNLFMKMSKSERNHSIRVCKSAMKYIDCNNILRINKDIMCKCALLHDIGKSQAKINILYKSIITILNSITCGKFLKYNKNKRVINYYNHPQIGVGLLENIGVKNLDILNCVRYHHNNSGAEKNIYLEILIICDNYN
ncbi:HD domain-containing protein [Clostridium sp.]|uniref:HD domain-containing protein n=1 Tax=Clostridium sp. TaxID=1506 RepID=UPI00261A0174|nr:HD domain-containing protein [Clostridium sp.]